MRRLLIVLSLLFLFCPSSLRAGTTQVIAGDRGGLMFQYIAKYVAWYNDDDTVRIEGDCVSSCTMVLGLVRLSNICATRNAQFGFHSASTNGEFSEEATRIMWALFSDKIRAALRKRGWSRPAQAHQALILIDAQEFVKPCKMEGYHE